MNYDKLSRSLRYYYEKGIMQKVSLQTDVGFLPLMLSMFEIGSLSFFFCIWLQSGELAFMQLQGHTISLDLQLVSKMLLGVGPMWQGWCLPDPEHWRG